MAPHHPYHLPIAPLVPQFTCTPETLGPLHLLSLALLMAIKDKCPPEIQILAPFLVSDSLLPQALLCQSLADIPLAPHGMGGAPTDTSHTYLMQIASLIFYFWQIVFIVQQILLIAVLRYLIFTIISM